MFGVRAAPAAPQTIPKGAGRSPPPLEWCYRAAGAAQTQNFGDVADDFADDFADNFADDFDDDFADDPVHNFQDDFLWLQNSDTCLVFGGCKIV